MPLHPTADTNNARRPAPWARRPVAVTTGGGPSPAAGGGNRANSVVRRSSGPAAAAGTTSSHAPAAAACTAFSRQHSQQQHQQHNPQAPAGARPPGNVGSSSNAASPTRPAMVVGAPSPPRHHIPPTHAVPPPGGMPAAGSPPRRASFSPSGAAAAAANSTTTHSQSLVRSAAQRAALGKACEPLVAFAMLCEYNSTHCGADKREQLTRFHCKTMPQISIVNYMAILAKNAEFEEEGVLLGLRLAGRYCRKVRMMPSLLCAHRLLVAATTLAVKMHCDRFRSNRTVARVGALALSELNNLEWTVFEGLQMQCIVPEGEVMTMLSSSQAVLDMHDAISSGPFAEVANNAMATGVTPRFHHVLASEAFGVTRHGQLRTVGGAESTDASPLSPGGAARRPSESFDVASAFSASSNATIVSPGASGILFDPNRSYDIAASSMSTSSVGHQRVAQQQLQAQQQHLLSPTSTSMLMSP